MHILCFDLKFYITKPLKRPAKWWKEWRLDSMDLPRFECGWCHCTLDTQRHEPLLESYCRMVRPSYEGYFQMCGVTLFKCMRLWNSASAIYLERTMQNRIPNSNSFSNGEWIYWFACFSVEWTLPLIKNQD